MHRRFIAPGALAAASVLLAIPASAASHSPGAPGIGDPYYPAYGNGGYDVSHYDLRLKYRTDRVVGSIKRACLKRPDTVAAAVKMVDTADASHPVRDWAPGKKKFGLAVAAG